MRWNRGYVQIQLRETSARKLYEGCATSHRPNGGDFPLNAAGRIAQYVMGREEWKDGEEEEEEEQQQQQQRIRCLRIIMLSIQYPYPG